MGSDQCSPAEALQAFRDHDAFGNRKFVDEQTGELRGGILVTAMPSPDLVPDELDPLAWRDDRKALDPLFAPAAVQATRPRMAELTTGIIDGLIEPGSAELVLDLANLGPALVTIEVMGLDPEDPMISALPFHESACVQASLLKYESFPRIRLPRSGLQQADDQPIPVTANAKGGSREFAGYS